MSMNNVKAEKIKRALAKPQTALDICMNGGTMANVDKHPTNKTIMFKHVFQI